MVKRKKVLKVVLRIILALLALAAIGFLVMMHVFFARYDETKTVDKIRSAGYEITQQFVPYGDDIINVHTVGNPQLPKVLLIHGSPGHWVDWSNVLVSAEALSRYCLIALDRPGYGGTTISATKGLSEQASVAARAMAQVLRQGETYAVAGHSYGGAVVEQMLVDFPDQVNRGIYVSGTLSPDAQKSKWYNYLAWPFAWILPKGLRSSNKEMMGLSKSLREVESRLRDVQQPVIMIHGTKDRLVPYSTVNYYKSMQPEGVHYMIKPDMDHFVPWSDPDLIIDAILAE